ncbi:MAG: hypothetical protein AAF961_17470, partial [Planctomycetota bacterium]
ADVPNQTTEAITRMRLADAFVPAVASLIAIWAVYSYSITEEKAHDVRRQLEERRGTGADDAEPSTA